MSAETNQTRKKLFTVSKSNVTISESTKGIDVSVQMRLANDYVICMEPQLIDVDAIAEIR